MKRFLIAIAAAVLTLASFTAQAQQMPTLPNDPAVRTGKLENGLTYYIRHNELPAQRAEFYLATNVGAFQETPDQDGLAHFLEHMCFNGTQNFPGKGILDYLQSIGAEFGRNINASTGFEETQYMLNNIPVERVSVVDSCLMILRDYAHFVLNEDSEIDAERGVIIEERRARRNSSWRLFEKSLPYMYGDCRYADCTLIGLQEHLETFDPESLRTFYRTWYHPDMQAVIVVGDIDVDRTEAKIKEIFSVIPKEENPTPKENVIVPGHAEPRFAVLTDPEQSSVDIEMLWKSEASPEEFNSTAIGKMQDIIKSIVYQCMRERFDDITAKADAPFLGANLTFSNLCENTEVVDASVTLKEDNIIGGFKDFYTEVERMKRYGFTDDEIGRAKTNIISSYENRAKKAETRRNAEFINPIIRHFFDNKAYMEPQAEYELIQTLCANINSQIINQICAQVITDENLVVLYNGPEKEGLSNPSADEIKAAYDEVKSSDIAPLEGEEIASEFLNKDALKGGKVKKTGTTIYGATTWTLSNGVEVVVYPTTHVKDQIIFRLYRDGGKSLIPTADLDSFDSNIFRLFISNSGVGEFTSTQTSKMLTGKHVSVSPFIASFSHGISGNSNNKDLETAFQLIYLEYAQPRFDQEEFNTGISQLKAVLPNVLKQPNFKFNSRLKSVLYGDNARQRFISEGTLEKASLATIERNMKSLFADAAGLKMVIVGDVDLDTLKPLVEKYIGAIAKGKKAPKWVDNKEYYVTGKVTDVFTTDMETPQSTVYQIYTADIKYSEEFEAALDAVSYILDMRYTTSLREEEGGTYGAQTSTDAYRKPVDKAEIEVVFDCRPSSTDKLRELAIKGITDLAEEGPTEKEVTAAILNLKKNIPENRLSNSYWSSNIMNFLEYGEDSDAAREAAINALDAAKIQQAVKDILASGNFIEVVQKPSNATDVQ